MTKRSKIRLASFALAALVVCGGLALQARAETAQLRRSLEADTQHAFAELVTGVGEIDAALQKSLYATSPALLSSTCTDIFGKAMAAQMSLGELPFADLRLERTTSFIAQVGDYAYALSRSAADGGISDAERQNLAALSATATQLSGELLRLQADLDEGVVTLAELSQSETELAEQEDGILPASGNSLQQIESEFPELPTLIYDGPFSQHIAERSPRTLEGMADVSEQEAREAAARFTGLKDSVFELYAVSEGALPTYCFSAPVDGGELTIAVTRQGGKVLTMRNARSVYEESISVEQAVELAKTFLEERGYANMVDSYYTKYDGSVLVNFAYAQDGVICYPDLVKVSVALDNGRIVGFESTGHLMNHMQRELPAVAVDVEVAKSRISTGLNVLSQRLAVIPTSGLNEVFCHEFICENADGRHYIVYVNAQTGKEEKILILLEDENGTLTL